MLLPSLSDDAVIDLMYIPNSNFAEAHARGLILSVNGIVLLQWAGTISDYISVGHGDCSDGVSVGFQGLSLDREIRVGQFRAVGQPDPSSTNSKISASSKIGLRNRAKAAAVEKEKQKVLEQDASAAFLSSSLDDSDNTGDAESDIYSYAEGKKTKRSPNMFRVMWDCFFVSF